MGNGDDIVYVEVDEVLRETDAALMIAEGVWVPISQIDTAESEVHSEGDSGVLALRRWIAVEKGLGYSETKPPVGCNHRRRKSGEPCPNCKWQPESEWVGQKAHQKNGAAAPVLGEDELGDEGPEAPSETSAALTIDVCSTPDALALAICRRVKQACTQLPAAPRILEPSAGDGAFVRAAREVWPTSLIVAIEPRKECEAALRALTGDVFVGTLETYQGLPMASFDLVVGNPPFSLAEGHLRLLLGAMHDGAYLAFLLRMGFYEARKASRGKPAAERLKFWTDYPELSFAPIWPRPGFKEGKSGRLSTDSQCYALFTWRAGEVADDGDGRRLPVREPHIVGNWSLRGSKVEGKPRRARARKAEKAAPPAPASQPLVDPNAPVLE